MENIENDDTDDNNTDNIAETFKTLNKFEDIDKYLSSSSNRIEYVITCQRLTKFSSYIEPLTLS
mgnify:CR=1 FL=1|jgi:hypothetical protein